MNAPNGIDSWLETYFEISCYVGSVLGSNESLTGIMKEDQEENGNSAHASRARLLTDKFESMYENENWFEKDWYGTIDSFISSEYAN